MNSLRDTAQSFLDASRFPFYIGIALAVASFPKQRVYQCFTTSFLLILAAAILYANPWDRYPWDMCKNPIMRTVGAGLEVAVVTGIYTFVF